MWDFKLEEIAVEYAFEAYKEGNRDRDRCFEILDEIVQGSEHIIYYRKAHEICQHCDIAAGEEYIHDIGPPSGGWDYNSIASAIAYGELMYRATIHLDDYLSNPNKLNAEKVIKQFHSN